LLHVVASFWFPLPVLGERVRVRASSHANDYGGRKDPHPSPLPEYREREPEPPPVARVRQAFRAPEASTWSILVVAPVAEQLRVDRPGDPRSERGKTVRKGTFLFSPCCCTRVPDGDTT
jgi:hypothetical protein